MDNIFCICSYCNEPIYGETDLEYGEDCVEMPDGKYMHYTCAYTYIRENRREAK